ncbi:MAG: hypothetical protein KQ78_01158 [Candidatus Izimaplasma bacterium HR2]|nr:MAG: hypothetical protein KQ78_01158 [Candidatus Izimaplasma bacterium HR2]
MRKYLLGILILTTFLLSACNPTKDEERIFVLGRGQDTVEINTSWEDAGAWLEYEDMKVDVDSTTGTVDETTLGLYEIVYSLTYEEKDYTISRYVIVVDQTKPIITLNEGVDSITANGTWVDSGAIATDNSGEIITIIISGTVDTTITGTYEIVYSAEDSSGNIETVTRYVTVFE